MPADNSSTVRPRLDHAVGLALEQGKKGLAQNSGVSVVHLAEEHITPDARVVLSVASKQSTSIISPNVEAVSAMRQVRWKVNMEWPASQHGMDGMTVARAPW